MSDAVEIRRNPDQSIDEVIAHGCNLHIEQMSNDGWYMGIRASDGSYWQFWFGSKNRRSHVEFRHTEMSPAEDEKSLKSLHKAAVISDDPSADPVQHPWGGAF